MTDARTQPQAQPNAQAQPAESARVLSTLNADGSRRWLRPTLSKGRWLNRRRAVGYFLIALFTVLPHLRIGGKPPLLIDIPQRELTLVGTTLYTSDTALLALLLIGVVVTVFLVSALFGRIWCGWACPQTVYLELVYRPIERFFDGAPGRKPKTGGWRKPAKVVAFIVVSMFLAHTFLAYFVGTDRLMQWMTRSPLEHPISFFIMAAVTGLMLFDFGFFREQTCIVACPYGRFQSAMLDADSLIITYDEQRGEPRGRAKRSRKNDDVSLKIVQDLGDCVDCGMCVRTCPTGIDIREGLQMECIGCAQCIDACDAVMDKLGRDRGLIRYSSQSALAKKQRHIVRPRVMLYAAVVTIVAALWITLFITRAPAYITLLRGPGAPYALLDDDTVSNPLKIKIQNRSQETQSYQLSIVGHHGGEIFADDNPLVIEPGEIRSEPILVKVPRDAFRAGWYEIAVNVSDGADFEKDVKYRLVGPARARPSGASPPKAEPTANPKEGA